MGLQVSSCLPARMHVDQVMRDVETVQENCSDILADAKAMNEERAEKEAAAFIEDGVQA